MTGMKDKIKKTSQGEKSSKEDFKQAIIKMEQKVAQISHEMRKKESQNVKIQEQYRKTTKENVNYKNSIEIVAKMPNEVFLAQPKSYPQSSGNSELCFMLKAGYEECQKKLVEENARLKESLELLHKEMTCMLNAVIEAIKKALNEKKNSSEMKCLEPIQLKPIIFQMPLNNVILIYFNYII